MSTLLDLVDAHYHGLEYGDAELALSPFSSDVKAEFPNGPINGIGDLRSIVHAFITAFPGMTIIRWNTWQADDTVMVEVMFRGTRTGPMATLNGSLPASGGEVTFALVDTFTAHRNEVVEHRVYRDNLTFLTQPGLMEESA
ncbi:ester cyclase [Rhodococcus erythropolis]